MNNLNYVDELRVRLRQQKEDSFDSNLWHLKSRIAGYLPAEQQHINKALDFGLSVDYRNHPGPISNAGYVNHILRAALLGDKLCVSDTADVMSLLLVHNVFEVSAISEDTLRAAVGKRITACVKALTVDRTKQYDLAYKEFYYAQITACGSVAACAKVLDKLDNLFLIGLNPRADIRQYYLEEFNSRVIPLALSQQAAIPGLGVVLEELTQEAEKIGFISNPEIYWH